MKKILQSVAAALALGGGIVAAAAVTTDARALAARPSPQAMDGENLREIRLEISCSEDEDGNVSSTVCLWVDGHYVGSGILDDQCINASFSTH